MLAIDCCCDNHRIKCALRYLEIGDGASLAPCPDDRPVFVAYGSSITQNTRADSPCRTWAALIAREWGYNLFNQGYGGDCHLDPMIAMMIRDLRPSLVTLCLGINVFAHGSMSARTFLPAILGFTGIIRERNPECPIMLISPLYALADEKRGNESSLTLAKVRQSVEQAQMLLRKNGDLHVHYVNGLDLFADDVHPNAEGYRLIAGRLRCSFTSILGRRSTDPGIYRRGAGCLGS